MDEAVEGMSRVMDAEGVVYRGHDGMRRLLDEMRSVFADFRSEVVAAVEGDDAVAAEVRFEGTGDRSGLATQGRMWQAIILREGKIRWFHPYETKAEALEAVRLARQPMSPENVDVVRRLYEAFSRGDMEGAVADFDAQIVWRWPEGVPGAMEVRGREEAQTVLKGYWNAWEEITISAEEFLPVGNDRLLVPNHHKGRGKGSGIETETRFCDLYTFREGKVVAFQGFWSKGEALKAVGLSE
jgi:ketosteroid isomerase-like protein